MDPKVPKAMGINIQKYALITRDANKYPPFSHPGFEHTYSSFNNIFIHSSNSISTSF
jgi:hypothetical protein